MLKVMAPSGINENLWSISLLQELTEHKLRKMGK